MRTLAWICASLVFGAALAPNRPADAAALRFLSRGTGFFVSKEGHLLTNFHVVDSCRQVTVQSGRLSGTARVVALDVANDLALLATNLRPEWIADWRSSVGDDEPVVVYGFPPIADRIVDGKVLGLIGARHNKLIHTGAGLEPGMSGSAVLNGGGLVIGIHVGHPSAPDIGPLLGGNSQGWSRTIARATGSAAALALLDAQRVTHPEARETKPLPKTEVIAKARAISAKVICQSGLMTDARICGRAGGTFLSDDKIIEACSREIVYGRLSGEALRLVYGQRAGAHLNKYQVDLAKRDCEEALKISEDSDGFRCLAGIFAATGDHGRAIAELDKAIRSFPKDIMALSMRAGYYVDKNDLDRAMADVDRAIEIDPDFPDAIWLRGRVLEKMQQHGRAMADFDRAIAIYSDLEKLYDAPTRRVDVLAQRGGVYSSKGDSERAIADFDYAIRLDRNNWDAFNGRGLAYNGKGDRDRAIADFDKAIGLNPAYAAAYYNRGNAYYAKGDRDRALADYDRAIRLSPAFDTAEVRQRRGETQ